MFVCVLHHVFLRDPHEASSERNFVSTCWTRRKPYWNYVAASSYPGSYKVHCTDFTIATTSDFFYQILYTPNLISTRNHPEKREVKLFSTLQPNPRLIRL